MTYEETKAQTTKLLDYYLNWLSESPSPSISWYTTDYHAGKGTDEHVLCQKFRSILPEHISLQVVHKHGGIEYTMSYKL